MSNYEKIYERCNSDTKRIHIAKILSKVFG